jgi:hypothetical protein
MPLSISYQLAYKVTTNKLQIHMHNITNTATDSKSRYYDRYINLPVVRPIVDRPREASSSPACRLGTKKKSGLPRFVPRRMTYARGRFVSDSRLWDHCDEALILLCDGGGVD